MIEWQIETRDEALIISGYYSYPHGILRQQQRGRNLSRIHNFEWHITIGVILL